MQKTAGRANQGDTFPECGSAAFFVRKAQKTPYRKFFHIQRHQSAANLRYPLYKMKNRRYNSNRRALSIQLCMELGPPYAGRLVFPYHSACFALFIRALHVDYSAFFRDTQYQLQIFSKIFKIGPPCFNMTALYWTMRSAGGPAALREGGGAPGATEGVNYA